MISEPKSQQINRSCLCEKYMIEMPANAATAGIIAGLGYGSYLGVKVTACDAALKSAYTSCSYGFCPGDCCGLLCKSLQCFGIATGTSLVIGTAAGCSAMTLGCGYLALRRQCCRDPCDRASENGENHTVEVDGDYATSRTMTAGSSSSYNAPPAYEELIGPPPSYDPAQDAGSVELTTWPASGSEN